MVDPFASDFTPRILSRLQRGDHVMEARLIPHAQHVSIVILVDGRGALQRDSTTRPAVGRRAASAPRRRRSLTATTGLVGATIV
jgi:hypothetical protein